MIKKSIRSTIILIAQFMTLALLTLLMAPLLFKKEAPLSQLHQFLSLHQSIFYIGHGLFYWALFLLWPTIVKKLANHQETTPADSQINQAVHSRYYLIGTCLLVEALNIWR